MALNSVVYSDGIDSPPLPPRYHKARAKFVEKRDGKTMNCTAIIFSALAVVVAVVTLGCIVAEIIDAITECKEKNREDG